MHGNKAKLCYTDLALMAKIQFKIYASLFISLANLTAAGVV